MQFQHDHYILLSICSGHRGHWPVVLGNAGPKHPDHDNGQEREERFKQSSVDLAVGTVADVDADDVLENLGNGEQQGSRDKIY